MPSFTVLSTAAMAVFLGVFISFVRNNPVLFGLKSANLDIPESELHIYKNGHHTLDGELTKFKDVIVGTKNTDDDYDAYRNHCLRVLTLAVHHMKKDLAADDDIVVPADGAFSRYVDVVAMALAYHDIGLWTDGGTLDYLEPSVEVMMREQQSKNNDDDGSSRHVYPPMFIDMARDIILQHHKYTDFTDGPNPTYNVIVNAVRKADWADFTYGLVRYDLNSTYLEATYDAIPEDGFHNVLLGMGRRLSPDSLKGRLDVFKIFKW